jgi:hypothetical protein
MKINSVFISEPIHVGWIIEKLMRDIADNLTLRGLRVRIGKLENYQGEDVVFHSRYLYATSVEGAKLNSLFVTHIDDRFKEIEISGEFEKFNSFVCCSQQDAEFLKGLGCSQSKILGNNLPHRGGNLRPNKIAIFSERYEDGRKNEDWLLEYFENAEPCARKGIVLCLLGYNWEGYCIKLAELGVSFELYRYDRSLQGEYDIQKEILVGMDYLIYTGFDGGAMCIYDGIMAGVKLIIADNSYHKGLGICAQLFKNKREFFMCLDELVESFQHRVNLWQERSVDTYVNNLLSHWEYAIINENIAINIDTTMDPEPNTKLQVVDELNFFRSHYKQISFRRFASSMYRLLLKNLFTKIK